MRLYKSLVFSFGLFVWSLCAHAGLEHLDKHRAAHLSLQFDNATPLDKDSLVQLQSTGWLCDMYGMRSRIQVEKGLKLYNFGDSDSPLRLNNSGAQIIKSYSISQGLRGRNGSLLEEIRLSKQGQLISRLEIKSPRDKSLKTLAISICQRLKS